MSEFLSWIEYRDKLYYLTKAKLNSKKGKALKEYCAWDGDLVGHGAIRRYYRLGSRGIGRECTDFSSPKNFPQEIVEAIKKGLFKGMGIPTQILTPKALAEYEKVEQSAWAEYKIALAKYEKITQPAQNKYKKTKRSARDKYQQIRQSTFWKLVKNPENRVDVWK